MRPFSSAAARSAPPAACPCRRGGDRSRRRAGRPRAPRPRSSPRRRPRSRRCRRRPRRPRGSRARPSGSRSSCSASEVHERAGKVISTRSAAETRAGWGIRSSGDGIPHSTTDSVVCSESFRHGPLRRLSKRRWRSGVAWDSGRRLLVVPVNNLVHVVKLRKVSDEGSAPARRSRDRAGRPLRRGLPARGLGARVRPAVSPRVAC